MSSQVLRRKQRQGGNTMVESALIILPLLALTFSIIDLSLVIFVKSTFQHAVREGVRFAITYQISGGSHDAAIKEVVRSTSMGLIQNNVEGLSKIHIDYFPPTDLSTPVEGEGSNAPGNVVEVSIRDFEWTWVGPILRSNTPVKVGATASDVMGGLPVGMLDPPAR